MRASILFALGSILFAQGCGFPTAVVGNGILKEDVRALGPFSGIDVGAVIEARISAGPVAKVTLSGDENLLPLIRSEVRDGVLVVDAMPNTNVEKTLPLKLDVVVPSLDRITGRGAARIQAKLECEATKFRIAASGASSVQVEGIATQAVEIDAEGASKVTIRGRATRLGVKGSGASAILAEESPAGSIEVALEGAAQAKLHATGSIQGRLSGASRLKILGDPKSNDVKTSGAASVESR